MYLISLMFSRPPAFLISSLPLGALVTESFDLTEGSMYQVVVAVTLLVRVNLHV